MKKYLVKELPEWLHSSAQRAMVFSFTSTDPVFVGVCASNRK
jgi:hypothetical protein